MDRGKYLRANWPAWPPLSPNSYRFSHERSAARQSLNTSPTKPSKTATPDRHIHRASQDFRSHERPVSIGPNESANSALAMIVGARSGTRINQPRDAISSGSKKQSKAPSDKSNPAADIVETQRQSATIPGPSCPTDTIGRELAPAITEAEAKNADQNAAPCPSLEEGLNLPKTEAQVSGTKTEKASEIIDGAVDTASTLSPKSQGVMASDEAQEGKPKSRQVSTAQGTPSKQTRHKKTNSKLLNKSRKDELGNHAPDGSSLMENTKPSSKNKLKSANQEALRNETLSDDTVAASTVNELSGKATSSSELPVPPPITNPSDSPPLLDKRTLSSPTESRKEDANENTLAKDPGATNKSSGSAGLVERKDGKKKELRGVLVATPLVVPRRQSKPAIRAAPSATALTPVETTAKIEGTQRHDGTGSGDRSLAPVSDPRIMNIDKISSPGLNPPLMPNHEESTKCHGHENAQEKAESPVVPKDTSFSNSPIDGMIVLDQSSTAPTSLPRTERSSSLVESQKEVLVVDAPESTTMNSPGVNAEQLHQKLEANVVANLSADSVLREDYQSEKKVHLGGPEPLHPSSKVGITQTINAHVPKNIEQDAVAVAKVNQQKNKEQPQDENVVDAVQRFPDDALATIPETETSLSATSSSEQSMIPCPSRNVAKSPERAQRPPIPTRTSSLPPAPVPEPIHTRHKKKRRAKGSKRKIEGTSTGEVSIAPTSATQQSSEDHAEVSISCLLSASPELLETKITFLTHSKNSN